MTRRLVVDLDGTLTVPSPGVGYADLEPDVDFVEQLRAYRADGFEIFIHTARNMRSFENSLGRINAHTLPGVIAWLDRHAIPYDEIHVGKPWCGDGGFYIDDRAIRPDEFKRLSQDEIRTLLGDDDA